MQTLMYIRSNKAVIVTKTLEYTDTYENFLKDGGDPLPAGLRTIDYQRTLNSCIYDGDCSEEEARAYGEHQIDKAEALCASFAARKKVFDDAYIAARFEMHDKEAKEAAEQAAKEHWAALTLDGYKKERLEELHRLSSAFEDNLNKDMYFISSNGFKCNGDRRTKSNLQDIVTFFDLQAQGGKVEYRDYDNQMRELTKKQVTVLLGEHVANGNALYTQKWQFEEQIKAAKSKEQLKKLKLDFSMSDFSKNPIKL